MKNEELYEALCDIRVNHITEAGEYRKTRLPIRIRWEALAACFAFILIVGMAALPKLFDSETITVPADSEYTYEKGYFYCVDEGVFSAYIGGKVIDDDQIGEKRSDVSVTAGWKNNADEWLTSEKLRGEIYSITGISENVAVALRFLDNGEAITTTHYYVILNPDADLTPVAEYIIHPTAHDKPDAELAGEIPE